MSDIVDAIRTLARTRDDAIQHVNFQSGGVRVLGFREVSASSLHQLLHAAGKRCDYTAVDGALVLDVYAAGPTVSATNQRMRDEAFTSSSSYVSLAMNLTVHTFDGSVSSEVVDELLDTKDVVDVHVTCSPAAAIRVLVAPPSQVVGGVADVIRRRGANHKRRPALTFRRRIVRRR